MLQMSNIKTLERDCWVYDVISEKCYHSDLGEYNTYGIKVIGSDYSMVVHDVSVSRDITENLAEQFSKYQLSPVHLKDVIMDMLP